MSTRAGATQPAATRAGATQPAATRAGTARAGRRQPVLAPPPATAAAVVGWWLSPSASVVWRAPVLLVLCGLAAWYAFRALVRLAFFVMPHLQLSFLIAPLLLPFAAIPAACFFLLIWYIPRLWRGGSGSPGRRALVTAAWLFGGFVVAQALDLVQIDLVLLLGIRLPRLPLDPF